MATTSSTTAVVNASAPVGRGTRLCRRATNSLRIMLYHLHNRDKPIAESDALRYSEPNIAVRSSDVGPSGSILRREHTVDADDGKGKIPVIAWNPPINAHVDHYALVCEDIDSRIGTVTHHGIFYNIPSARWNANEGDIKRQTGENKPRLTHSAWNYVTTYNTDSYSPISPPRGHGSHRYVFTVLALSQRLTFDHPDKVTKMEFHRALSGKVVGWGQWIGVFGRPWSKK